MARKINQWQRNMAKEMFQTSDSINELGRALLQPDTVVDVPMLRDLEDRLFGAIVMARQTRHKLTETPIHEKGQKA